MNVWLIVINSIIHACIILYFFPQSHIILMVLLKIVFPIFQIISLLMNELFLHLLMTRCVSSLAAGLSWALAVKEKKKSQKQLLSYSVPFAFSAFGFLFF